MGQEVIQRLNQIGASQKMPAMLAFGNRHGIEIKDNIDQIEDDPSEKDSYQPSDGSDAESLASYESDGSSESSSTSTDDGFDDDDNNNNPPSENYKQFPHQENHNNPTADDHYQPPFTQTPNNSQNINVGQPDNDETKTTLIKNEDNNGQPQCEINHQPWSQQSEDCK